MVSHLLRDVTPDERVRGHHLRWSLAPGTTVLASCLVQANSSTADARQTRLGAAVL